MPAPSPLAEPNADRGFAAGLFCTTERIVKDSRESRHGRPDIAVHDTEHSRGMFLERQCAERFGCAQPGRAMR